MLRKRCAVLRLFRRALATQAAYPRERAVTLVASRPQALLPALNEKLAAWSNEAPHLLLFALSKSLPQAVLAEAVELVYKAPAQTRVGFLSTHLPASLVGGHASQNPMHAVSLAALPPGRGLAFRSTIPGVSRTAVGRWPSQKERWKQGTEARSDRLDHTSDWRSLWGKENVELRIPEAFSGIEPSHVKALLLASDAYAQGLLEGIDAHFPHASVLGTIATLTPFETGREHTLFFDTQEQPRRLFEKGAVGVALCSSSPSHATLARSYEHLVPIGPRLALTSARGNIISTLDNYNAAQQFLRLILQKQPAPPSAQTMEASQVRALSSSVRKEDEFYMGVFEDHPETPELMAKVLSGHPMRGTLSIDTEAELGGPGNTLQSPRHRWVQFYRPGPTEARHHHAPHGQARFVFLAYPGDASLPLSADPAVSWAHTHQDGARELPDVFLAASEQGWLASNQVSVPTYACNVPYARASLYGI